MFGLSFGETLLIVAVILIVFGPERLPELAQKAGRIFGQVRGQMDSVRREFYNTVYTPAEDLKRQTRELGRELRSEPVVPKVSVDEPNELAAETNPDIPILRSEERSPLCPDFTKSNAESDTTTANTQPPQNSTEKDVEQE